MATIVHALGYDDIRKVSRKDLVALTPEAAAMLNLPYEPGYRDKFRQSAPIEITQTSSTAAAGADEATSDLRDEVEVGCQVGCQDGYETELSWSQVKGRCKELGLEHVPELHREIIYLSNPGEIALNTSAMYVVGESVLDESHIREGVCVRIEKENGKTKTYKHKSFLFELLEGIAKESDDYVDVEEIN